MNATIEQQKPNILFILIKKIFILLLPAITLIKLNLLLSRCQKITKNEYFELQKKRNYIISGIISIPFLLGLLLSMIIIYKNDMMMNNLIQFKMLISKGIIIEAFKKFYNAFFHIESLGYSIAAIKVLSIGSVISMIMGFIVIKNMEIISQTKLLENLLKRNGIIEKDENRIVLATPVGFLIDITGSSAKELMYNERIWMALNIKIKDYIEDPNKRSVVFYQKAYELQNKYIYAFNQKK